MDMKCMSQSTTKRIRPKMASPSRASASTAILEERRLRSREGRGGRRNGGTRHPGRRRAWLPHYRARRGPACPRLFAKRSHACRGAEGGWGRYACATLGASPAVIRGLCRVRLRCGGWVGVRVGVRLERVRSAPGGQRAVSGSCSDGVPPAEGVRTKCRCLSSQVRLPQAPSLPHV